jgi:hypothetical protein
MMAGPDDVWPESPNPAHTSLRLVRLSVPFRTAFPSEGEATGLLVKVLISGPAEATFRLRHSFISSDVGLPGAGIPLEGGIRVQDGRARVVVYTSAVWAAFVGGIVSFMVLSGLAIVVHEGGMWNIVWLASFLMLLLWSYRRMQTGIRRVASDAVLALERLSASGRTDPWE